ncbi:unnamed protein product [Aphanomyces euteiches]
MPLWQPYRGQIQMVFSFNAHLSDEIDEEGVTIAALETRYRHTIPTDFRSAAATYWETATHTNSTIKMELVDSVDDRFAYCRHVKNRVGTQLLSISGIFHEDNRAIVTHCYVANDELFPFEDGILRPHGFAWYVNSFPFWRLQCINRTIFEAMSSGMTLVHNFALQHTPVTADGRVIPLERIGRLFSQSPTGARYRDAYIDRSLRPPSSIPTVPPWSMNDKLDCASVRRLYRVNTTSNHLTHECCYCRRYFSCQPSMDLE